jgi:tetratricopeptide (TPR) repeat protein
VRDFSNAGWRAYRVGRIEFLRRQSPAVIASADRAEAHWHEARAGAREFGAAMQLRGMGYELANDYIGAIPVYREAVKLWRSLSQESEEVAIGLNALANAEYESDNLDAAERDYREALRIANVTNYPEGVATYTGNLAELALDRSDWTAGEALAREALSLAEKVGRRELIASDCRRLAVALVRQGKKAEALPYAQRAVEIFFQLGTPKVTEAREILAECEN